MIIFRRNLARGNVSLRRNNIDSFAEAAFEAFEVTTSQWPTHRNELSAPAKSYFDRSPEKMWIFSSNLPGNLALKNGGDFW